MAEPAEQPPLPQAAGDQLNEVPANLVGIPGLDGTVPLGMATPHAAFQAWFTAMFLRTWP